MKTCCSCLGIGGALLALNVGVCRAQDAEGGAAVQPDASIPQRAAALGRAGSAGQMVFIDPMTGKFTTPTTAGQAMPDAIRQPDPALDSSSEGLEQVVHPDGSVSVDLKGRFRSRAYATLDQDGNAVVSHRPDTAEPRMAPGTKTMSVGNP